MHTCFIGCWTQDNPPVLLLHGTDDAFVDIRQSQRFAARAEAVGADVHFKAIEEAGHSFHLEPPAPAADLKDEVIGFLDQHLQ